MRLAGPLLIALSHYSVESFLRIGALLAPEFRLRNSRAHRTFYCLNTCGQWWCVGRHDLSGFSLQANNRPIMFSCPDPSTARMDHQLARTLFSNFSSHFDGLKLSAVD